VIDRELVTRKIVHISGDLEELRKLDSAGLQAYLADPYKEILAERFLERMISRMIDVNYHVITGSGHPLHVIITTVSPNSGRWHPRTEVRLRNRQAAGLRNLIVHEYDEIEPEKVFEAIRSALADLPVYLKAVLSFIG